MVVWVEPTCRRVRACLRCVCVVIAKGTNALSEMDVRGRMCFRHVDAASVAE